MTERASNDSLIKLAIMAVGGQGGGVLTNWIEGLARSQGYAVQATSVAGVAQRTGATIYYVEMAPNGGPEPVFALAPSAGDVDILIAAELMEAGRAIQRGFVTSGRTVLIASNHRALAVSEKIVPGDGVADGSDVFAAAAAAAQRSIFINGEEIAARNQSAISAALFGALAGSGALPFPVEAFEEAIRSGGKGVEASLSAFRDAADIARSGGGTPAPKTDNRGKLTRPNGSARQLNEWDKLLARALTLPPSTAEMAVHGLRKVVAFQDIAYGREYLDRLDRVAATDNGDHGSELTREAAKYIANAMAYDDVIGVAGSKTTAVRTSRIRSEVGKPEALQVIEYFHPRTEEIVGLLPARIGARMSSNPKSMARIDRWFCKGRRIRSDRLGGFLGLYFIGGLRGWRRRTYRHQIEQEHLNSWLDLAIATARIDYQLGCEILKTRRLIKGYSDTHTRSLSKFDRVIGTLPLLQGRGDAADWLHRLTAAALQDEEGEALGGAIKTVASL